MSNTKKIRIVSRIMSVCCMLALVILPLINLGVWLNIESFAPEIAGISILPEYIGTMNKLMGFLASMIPTSLLMWGVWRLRGLFELFAQSIFFTEDNAKHLHSFASMLLYSFLLGPVASVLTSVATTFNYPQGQRSIALELGTDDINRVFLAMVFFAISWVMKEAYKLARENAEFV